MSRKFTSTTEEVQDAIKALQHLQFQKEQLDKRYAVQFNSLFVLVASLPDSEEQDMLYATLYYNNYSLKEKRENEEEQYYNRIKQYKSEVCNCYKNNNNNINNSNTNNK
jgi:hypothetical protein